MIHGREAQATNEAVARRSCTAVEIPREGIRHARSDGVWLMFLVDWLLDTGITF